MVNVKELTLDKDIAEMVRARRLSFFGHVIRTDNQRYPHVRPILYRHVVSGSSAITLKLT